MNPQEVVYSFPRYEYVASGVWHEKENQSLTAFLGNFPPLFSFGPNSYKAPPTLDDNSVFCVATVAGSSFPLEKSADGLSENCSVQINKNENFEIKTGAQSETSNSEVENTKTEPKPAIDNSSTSCVAACSSSPLQKSDAGLSEENCSAQINNKNEDSEVKTGGQSGAPKVKNTKRKSKRSLTIAEYLELERQDPNMRPLFRSRSVPWWSIPNQWFPARSIYSSSLRFRVYGFLTHHDLWGVPISHPMIPRKVQEIVWYYGMEREREFRNHQRWISLDYFPNHAPDCWLCMKYSDREYEFPNFGHSCNSEFFEDSDSDSDF